MPSPDPYTEYKSKADLLIKQLRHRGAGWPNAPELQNIGDRTVDNLLDLINTQNEARLQQQWGVGIVCVLLLMSCLLAAREITFVGGIITVLLVWGNDNFIRNTSRYAVYALRAFRKSVTFASV